MSTDFNKDVSPEVLDLARMIQRMVDSAVKRADAEKAARAEPEPAEYVTTKEAAAILKVKPRTVYTYTTLKAVRRGAKGGRLMYRREEVERVARGET